MKKLWQFLCNNGTIIMLIGRLIVFVCLIFLVAEVLNGGAAKNRMHSISWAIIFVGVAFYVVGWMGVQGKKRQKQKKENTDTLA